MLEVLPVAARRRPALALVLRADRRRAVRRRGRLGHLHEGDLPDLHAGIDRDREVRDVRELERHVAVPARVDEAGRRVDEQAEAAERALPLEPRDEVVGQPDPLERRAEHELAGVEDERVRRPPPRRARSAPPARPSRRCTGSGCCGRRGRTGRRGRRRSTAAGAPRRTGRSRSCPRRGSGRSSRRRGPRGDEAVDSGSGEHLDPDPRWRPPRTSSSASFAAQRARPPAPGSAPPAGRARACSSCSGPPRLRPQPASRRLGRQRPPSTLTPVARRCRSARSARRCRRRSAASTSPARS